MSDFKKTGQTAQSTGSLGGLVWLIGSLVSYFSTTAFKIAGWTGVGKAMLVGSGSALGWSILAIPGVLLGGAFGAVLGGVASRNSRSGAGAGAIAGGMIGAITVGGAAGIYGATEGYSLSRQWLTAAAPVPAVRTLDTPVQAPGTTITVARPAA